MPDIVPITPEFVASLEAGTSRFSPYTECAKSSGGLTYFNVTLTTLNKFVRGATGPPDAPITTSGFVRYLLKEEMIAKNLDPLLASDASAATAEIAERMAKLGRQGWTIKPRQGADGKTREPSLEIKRYGTAQVEFVDPNDRNDVALTNLDPPMKFGKDFKLGDASYAAGTAVPKELESPLWRFARVFDAHLLTTPHSVRAWTLERPGEGQA